MKIKYGGKPQKSPVEILDEWIESYNHVIEDMLEDAEEFRYLLNPAIFMLSEVIDFFNGADPGALAQSGRK